PMALDIALIQQRYGANPTTGLGDSSYALSASNSAYRAIWDNGGTDTISYSGGGNATIDLRAATLLNAVGGGGYVSFVQGVHGGWTIANGVVIENATGGNNNDTLIGNEAANVLNGGIGADNMQGAGGNDTYVVDSLSDIVFESSPGGGTDTVNSSASNYQLTANVENLVLMGTTANGGGNALNNSVTGNAQSNLIWGGDGNDILDGGAGVDVMDGGNGDDIYYVDTFGETTYEASALGGTDTVYASVEVSLAANVENLIVVGAAVNGGGNGLHNNITGNANSNLIWGLEGNDWLDGAGGADQMDGGNGDDTYVVDNNNDVTWEGSALGGVDTVRASLSWILGPNIEYLTLLASAYYGGGNSLNNVIIGNSADNLIWGADGDDILDGGLGADAMDGGNGNDFYIVDNNNDFVYEASALGGADTVVSSVSYILGANVEVLSITGSASYAGGNSANNYIVGNAGANLLWGADGNDTLDGWTGADAMDGGNGDDTYLVDNIGDVTYEASSLGGIDTVESSVSRTLDTNLENLKLVGSAAINGAGNSANNVITGNGAANVLTGGAGDDAFVFTTALGPSNIDTITDFNVANDTIHLSTAIFTGIGGAGVLSAAAFHIGAAAADASDRIIYDSATGALYYDADGNGGGAAIQFATLATGLALTNVDFLGFGP
ncbi:MAG: M10 family metallopeptidase C-terminal domain-containing protein, partial [Hyphomonadaceae bacterium]|nr:M10 family metallopeptidase C-terminal domain-containing protein [Hyphomonadaceae bacterium]